MGPGAPCAGRTLTLSLLCPPADCVSYSASHVLTRRCYGRQRCSILVDNHHFGSPCLPGARKYLTVAYACGKTIPSTRAACLEEVAVAASTAAANRPSGSAPETGHPRAQGRCCCL